MTAMTRPVDLKRPAAYTIADRGSWEGALLRPLSLSTISAPRCSSLAASGAVSHIQYPTRRALIGRVLYRAVQVYCRREGAGHPRARARIRS